MRSTRPIRGSARFTESIGWRLIGTRNDSRETTLSSSYATIVVCRCRRVSPFVPSRSMK